MGENDELGAFRDPVMWRYGANVYSSCRANGVSERHRDRRARGSLCMYIGISESYELTTWPLPDSTVC